MPGKQISEDRDRPGVRRPWKATTSEFAVRDTKILWDWGAKKRWQR